MKKLSCAIVDDEPLAIKLIENFMGRVPFLEHAASYTDSVTASVELIQMHPDLLFLDIQMPDMDGMELARMIGPSTGIIFTTAFREYALDSYDVAAIDYLMKPIRFDRFLLAVQKARKWLVMQRNTDVDTDIAGNQHKEEIFLKKDGGFKRVTLDRIIMVEGMKDYVKVYIEGERFPIVTHLTMKGIEDSLPQDRFMRVSRSHIIALRHIHSVDRNMVIYIGDTMVKVTDMYKGRFETFLKDNMPGK